MARPVWKGQLRLSLVAIPVEMFPATKSGARVSFRQIHGPTGKPIRYQKVAAGVGPVDPADIMKGFEYDKDRYVLIEPEELEAIKLESKRTIDLVQFVDACEIPPLYFDKPYYLVPSDELAEEAYRVLRDALRESGKVGIGQVTLRGLEYLAAITPCGDGLLLETLHYADEVRNAEPMFAGIEDHKVDKDLLEVATTLIERKTSKFNAEAYVDHYSKALKEFVKAKQSNKASKKVDTGDEPAPAGDNVIDLMAALKQSLKKAQPTEKSAKPKARRRKSA